MQTTIKNQTTKIALTTFLLITKVNIKNILRPLD